MNHKEFVNCLLRLAPEWNKADLEKRIRVLRENGVFYSYGRGRNISDITAHDIAHFFLSLAEPRSSRAFESVVDYAQLLPISATGNIVPPFSEIDPLSIKKHGHPNVPTVKIRNRDTGDLYATQEFGSVLTVAFFDEKFSKEIKLIEICRERKRAIIVLHEMPDKPVYYTENDDMTGDLVIDDTEIPLSTFVRITDQTIQRVFRELNYPADGGWRGEKK